MKTTICFDLDNRIYPKQAVFDAKSAFASYADVRVVQNGRNVALSFTVKPAFDSSRRQIYLEFLNYLLDRTIQIVAEKEAQ